MLYCIILTLHAGVMELADVADSKSAGSDTVPVRVRSPAPEKPNALLGIRFLFLQAKPLTGLEGER